MHSKPGMAVLIYLLLAGCVTSKVPQQDFIDNNTDSLFLSGYVQRNWNGYIECMGYNSHGYQVLSESFNEDVKRAGLILDAKSILTTSGKIRSVFGNEKDSCILLFTRSVNSTRHGRSALTSVSNAVSAVKGQPYTPQDKPDTLLSSIISGGTIMLKDQLSGFYYKHNYDPMKRVSYEGWLVLRGDTIMARQVRDNHDDNGKLINDNWSYYYWLQLQKNGSTYAAIFVSKTSKMKLYISKNLSEAEKMLVAAYFSIIVFNS